MKLVSSKRAAKILAFLMKLVSSSPSRKRGKDQGDDETSFIKKAAKILAHFDETSFIVPNALPLESSQMYSTYYRVRDNDLEGVLVPTEGVSMLTAGNEATMEEGKYVFKDLDAFDRVLSTVEHTESPYKDFLRTPLSHTNEAFNWRSVPVTTMGVIMEHQKSGVNQIVEIFGGRCLLALKPGLGKTMIACLAATHYGKRILVICPASKRMDWRLEFVKWTGLTLKGVCVRSFNEMRTSDDLLNRDWDCVVVDECHKLKRDSDQTLKILPLLKRVDSVLLLSGTPVENRPCELFNQLSAVRPDIFCHRETFTERYADGKIGSRGWEERGATYLEELAAIMKRVMYRRNDVVVVEHPIERKLIYLAPTDEEFEVLEKQEDRRKKLAIAEENAKTPLEKTIIVKARNKHINEMWRTSGQFKAEVALERVKAIVKAHPSEKVIVYCFHRNNAEAVKTMMDTLGKTVLVTGSTPEKKRQELLNRLANPSSPTRFGVLTISAIGEAVNLAPGVSVVIFLELDRTPSKMAQAEARAHRIKCVKTVSTYWILLNQSSDELLFNKLMDKTKIANTIMGGGEDFKFVYEERPANLVGTKEKKKRVTAAKKRVKVEKNDEMTRLKQDMKRLKEETKRVKEEMARLKEEKKTKKKESAEKKEPAKKKESAEKKEPAKKKEPAVKKRVKLEKVDPKRVKEEEEDELV